MLGSAEKWKDSLFILQWELYTVSYTVEEKY